MKKRLLGILLCVVGLALAIYTALRTSLYTIEHTYVVPDCSDLSACPYNIQMGPDRYLVNHTYVASMVVALLCLIVGSYLIYKSYKK